MILASFAMIYFSILVKELLNVFICVFLISQDKYSCDIAHCAEKLLKLTTTNILFV